MAIYLLQVTLFQLLFLAFYLLVLRKETFFTANRVYLLITAALSFLLPFAEIEMVQQTLPMQLPVTQLPEITIGATNEVRTKYLYPGDYDETPFWISLIYLAGFVIAFRLFAQKLVEVNRLYRFRRKGDNQVITVPNRFLAFTYLQTIFLGDRIAEADREQVLKHELVHLREGHGFDLLVFEILRVVMWFNPLIYLYQRLLAETHEFLADKNAIKKTELKTYANQLLNLAFETQHVSFVNTFFNQSLIKKRIVMLQKQSRATARLKYIFILPLIAGMIAVASCSDEEKIFPKNQSDKAEETEYTAYDAFIPVIDGVIKELEAKSERTVEQEKALEQFISWKETAEEARARGAKMPPLPVAPKNVLNVQKNNTYNTSSVPFAVIDEVPKFPGCDAEENEAARKCFSQEIDKVVKANFNTDLGKQLGLSGINRVYVQFAITETGDVQFLKSRAPHPELEKEAERVIDLVPDVTPGKQGGKPVKVLYSLPIVFQV